jgi:tripartite-type tricarboxylate transporter receptor subunit TctC
MTGSSTQAANVSLYKTLPFDPEKDFAPIASMATVPYILVVNPARVPVSTFQEFVAFVKSRPGQLSYASSAITGRLAGEILQQRMGLQATFVPYKTLAQVVSDIIGGHLDYAFGDPQGCLPHVHSGRLRAIAVTTRARIAAASDIPTLAESGVADFDVSAWLALYGKAGMPAFAIQRFNQLINEVLEAPEGQAFLTSIGLQPLLGKPDQLAALQKRDTLAWAQAIRAAGITIE